MKNIKKLTALVLTLALFVLALSGCGTEKTDGGSSDSTASYSYSLKKRTAIQAVRGDFIEVLVDKDGNAYLYTLDSSDNAANEEENENLKKIENRYETYSPKDYKSFDATELKAYKLDISGVLTAYYVHLGNGGFSYFVFVKENGTLSYLSYDKLIYEGEIVLKDIDGLKNIVSVVENTYSMTPYAIDFDGNEISLYDYIKVS